MHDVYMRTRISVHYENMHTYVHMPLNINRRVHDTIRKSVCPCACTCACYMANIDVQNASLGCSPTIVIMTSQRQSAQASMRGVLLPVVRGEG